MMAVAVTVHGGRGSSSRWLGTERIYVDVSADVVIFLALKKTAWQQMRHTERARANIHMVTFDMGCFTGSGWNAQDGSANACSVTTPFSATVIMHISTSILKGAARSFGRLYCEIVDFC